MESTDFIPLISLISLIASIASLILAIVAIWLSISFFKMSSKLANNATEATKDMGSIVIRLEKLFDKLYADTFSIMRDTVTDMRKHIWPDDGADAKKLAGEAEQLAEQKVGEVKQKIEKDLGELLKRQEIADELMSSIQSEMENLIDEAISKTQQVKEEAREETLRSHIFKQLNHLLLKRSKTTAEELLNSVLNSGEFHPTGVVDEIEEMIKEGLIETDCKGALKHDTKVWLPEN